MIRAICSLEEYGPSVAEMQREDTFPGYQLVRQLGAGAMGEVYEAKQLSLGRHVALKVIKPEKSAESGYRARFRREANLAAAIEHPNVLPVYDVGETHDGRLFLTMRLVKGQNLETYLTGQPGGTLEPAHTIALLSPIADALDALHAKRLVHRDVKPENVLIQGDDERVFLADFGLARQVSGGTLTVAGQIVGTPAYMAPEQINGGNADSRTDVYALGCIIFRCITGKCPYSGRTDVEVGNRILHSEIPVPSEIVPGLGSAYDDLVKSALAKNPNDRPPTAGELMALSGNLQLKLADRTLDRQATDARRGRRVLRHLVNGRTSHPFDEEMVYQYTIGETDDDDVATYLMRTIAKDEAGPGVFWRTVKFNSMNPHAKLALKDGRVALSVDYVGEPPWKGALEWVQTNEEVDDPNNPDVSIDVAIVFPQAIPPGSELAWRVEAQWPGFHYNIRYNNGRDRMAITLKQPRRRLEFVLQLPPLAKSARLIREPDYGRVVRSDNEILHWQSHSPAPAGQYLWDTQIDRQGPWL